MINYAAKARKAYLINNFDKILNSLNTLHSTVETMTLFVNDQAYNYILKLKEVIKTSPMYKHNIKRLLNDMDKEIKKYNASIYYINKERSEVIADITQAMEDYLMPYIDDLAGAIRAAVWSRGVSEERTEAAVLSLIVSSLSTLPSLPQLNVPIYSVAITKHTLSTRAIPLHRSLEYPLLDQFSFVYNPPSTCWMYMPLLIISEGFTPIPI
nr:MAG TPA: hypothetical protein [Caudoviricetes sp.]